MSSNINIPARNVYLSADGTSTGQAGLNSTWGFVKKAAVNLNATGKPTLECEVLEVSPAAVTLKLRNTNSYNPIDISAYTMALNAQLTQPAQILPVNVSPFHIDPFYRVTLELLNAPQNLIGTITSVGTSANNHTTAVPFYDTASATTPTAQALKELVVTVVPDIACSVKVGTSNSITATTTDMPLQGGEKLTLCLSTNQGWISVIAASGGSVNLKVYRHQLQ